MDGLKSALVSCNYPLVIVEDRLIQVLSQLWEDVLSQPNRNVDEIIADR